MSLDKKDYDNVVTYIENTFPHYQLLYEETIDDMVNLEYIIESRWTFPEKEMNGLLEVISDIDSFSATVLSVEWGCLYCAFFTCDDGAWKYE